jgi:hypothetical protein
MEFRLRMAINAAIIILGFWAPWIEAWGIGRRISLIEWLALGLSRSGTMSFSVATAVFHTHRRHEHLIRLNLQRKARRLHCRGYSTRVKTILPSAGIEWEGSLGLTRTGNSDPPG